MARYRSLWSVVAGLSLAVSVVGQTFVAAEPSTGSLHYFSAGVSQPATQFVAPGITHVAFDGVDTVWTSPPDERCLFRVTISTGLVEIYDLVEPIVCLALAPNGDVVFGSKPGPYLGPHIHRVTPSGDYVWSASLAGTPTSITCDADGFVFASTYSAMNGSEVLGVDGNGSQIWNQPIGPHICTTRLGPEGSVWASSPLIYTVFEFDRTDGTVLVGLTSNISPVDFAFDLDGGMWVVDPVAGAYGHSLAGSFAFDDTVVGADFREVAVDGQGRLWATTWNDHEIRCIDPDGGVGSTWTMTGGLSARGDGTGISFAMSGGQAVDADVDGFDNGEEVRGGSHPFDPTSTPLRVEWIASDDSVGVLGLRAHGWGGSAYFFGVSHGGTARGQGVWGTSLIDGPLFRAVLASPGVVAPLVGFLDGNGEATIWIQYPDNVSLSGMEFAAAFVVLPDLPSSFFPMIPSAATSLQVP